VAGGATQHYYAPVGLIKIEPHSGWIGYLDKSANVIDFDI
jgi:hypothetical protein